MTETKKINFEYELELTSGEIKNVEIEATISFIYVDRDCLEFSDILELDIYENDINITKLTERFYFKDFEKIGLEAIEKCEDQ